MPLITLDFNSEYPLEIPWSLKKNILWCPGPMVRVQHLLVQHQYCLIRTGTRREHQPTGPHPSDVLEVRPPQTNSVRIFRIFGGTSKEYMYLLSQQHFFIAFRERGRETGCERENHWCERKTLTGCFPYTRGPEIQLATWIRALTRNQTCNLSVIGQHFKQLSHIGQGRKNNFLKSF